MSWTKAAPQKPGRWYWYARPVQSPAGWYYEVKYYAGGASRTKYWRWSIPIPFPSACTGGRA
jgi:hypothetical protein